MVLIQNGLHFSTEEKLNKNFIQNWFIGYKWDHTISQIKSYMLSLMCEFYTIHIHIHKCNKTFYYINLVTWWPHRSWIDEFSGKLVKVLMCGWRRITILFNRIIFNVLRFRKKEVMREGWTLSNIAYHIADLGSKNYSKFLCCCSRETQNTLTVLSKVIILNTWRTGA